MTGRISKAEVKATGTTTPRSLADWTSKETLTYNNIAEAKADTKLDIGQSVKTLGYYSAGDGGVADYVVVAVGTGVDDGGSYHDMTNGNQLQLIHDGSVDTQVYGATTITGSDSALQAALDSPIKRVEFSRDYNLTTLNKLQVGSNKIVVGVNRPVIKQTQTGDAKGFEILPASTGVEIYGFDIRGPYYGITTLYSGENIGINISGRWDQFNNSQPTTTNPCEDILISNNWIEGFGQSGILADLITNFTCIGNKIHKCGRDGVRTYGVFKGRIALNDIDEMAPGVSGIAPNLNVYGVSLTMVYQLPLTTYPRTEQVVVSNNTVRGCYTWKSLDSHGSTHCTFSDNICYNSHIGMGIAQGKDVKTDYCKVVDNQFIFEDNPSTIPRSGVAMFAGPTDPAGQSGQSNHVIGNTIKGYGVSGGDGAISISNQESFQVSDNIIEDSLKAGITVISPCDGSIMNNTIRRVTTDAFGGNFGIAIQNTQCSVSISGGILDKSDLTMQGISLPTPDAGFTISVFDDITFNCDTDVVQPNRINGGNYQYRVLGRCQILNTGTPSFSFKNGIIDTVTRTGIGQLTVTFTRPFFNGIYAQPQGSTISNTPVLFGFLMTNESTLSIRTTDASGVLLDTGFKLSVSGF
jgi:hypothetical protein